MISFSLCCSVMAGDFKGELLELLSRGEVDGERISQGFFDKYVQVGFSEDQVYGLLNGEGLPVSTIKKSLCTEESDHALYSSVKLDYGPFSHKRADLFFCISKGGSVVGFFGYIRMMHL